MRLRPGPVLLLLLASLAGCFDGHNGPPTPTTHPTTTPPAAIQNGCTPYPAPGEAAGSDPTGAFSGEEAFQALLRVVCDHSSGTPQERPRVPGTGTHTKAAADLLAELQGQGWTATAQSFTGADYQSLPKGSVAAFANCRTTADAQRLEGLAFTNVVADRGQGDLYLFLAHWESKRFANQDSDADKRQLPVLGANDGASGVAVLLEAARTLQVPAHVQVRILLVDGEDGFDDCHPLAGSIYHAQKMSAEERDRVKGILLLDMVGDPDVDLCLMGTDAAMEERIKAAGRKAGTALAETATCPRPVLDDHSAFIDAGMNATDLIAFSEGEFVPYWHTADDVPRHITATQLGQVGATIEQLIENL